MMIKELRYLDVVIGYIINQEIIEFLDNSVAQLVKDSLNINKSINISLVSKGVVDIDGKIKCDDIDSYYIINTNILNIKSNIDNHQSIVDITKELIDWNEPTIDNHIAHLEEKFKFDSSGTAKSIHELITAYKKSYTTEEVKDLIRDFIYELNPIDCCMEEGTTSRDAVENLLIEKFG